jgi:tRNA (Thr-GGU) A37 N-methylase
MIRNTKATQHNKWQQKRLRNDKVMTLNVNQRFEDGTQGLKTKSKNLPSMFENK